VCVHQEDEGFQLWQKSNWLSECDAHLKLTAQAELFMCVRAAPAAKSVYQPSSDTKSFPGCLKAIRELMLCVYAELLSFMQTGLTGGVSFG
jgi:hypothetical protein